MRKIQSIALMMAIALTGTTAFTACTSEENENLVYDDNGHAGVKSEFVISIPRSVVGITRMTSVETQSEGTYDQFRGIDNIRLIPFSQEPEGTTSKNSGIITLTPIDALNKPGSVNYKIYANQFVPTGTTHFLFYGKAIDNEEETPITSMDDKFRFGILNAKGLTDDEFTTPNNILITLEQINTSTAAQAGNATGQNIVNLLTSLANTTSSAAAPNDKWATTSNNVLASLYKNFIGLTTSSSSTLSVVLGKLHYAMDHVLATDPARPLANAIKTKIEAVCTSIPSEGNPASLSSDFTGYPADLGLPEGAARIRWNASGVNANTFTDVSVNFTKNFKMKNTDYVYPAALWYYVNTPLKAANQPKSDQYIDQENWAQVINNVYNGADNMVSANTQSIALEKAVEYGVGRIETKIAMGAGPFYDGNGKEVDTDTNFDGFRLKGILIGGQNSVGYDFTPNGSQNMAIYDRMMSGSNITATKNYTTPANHTLALETKSDQIVNAALELVNGGPDFVGADGIIPAGGTFYLPVTLNPKDASNYVEGKLDKIVIQDHVTLLTVTIKNGSTTVDRDNNNKPDTYVKDPNGVPIGVDSDGDGVVDPYDIDDDGLPDTFITDPAHGGPGWDTDGDGEVDLPVTPNPETGEYPDSPNIPEGLGTATNGVPDLTSPGVELGTSVNLEWQQGLILTPNI